jgi:general secretion pathway protein K
VGAADSLTDAILDWRDSDDERRPLGAEAAWYRSQHTITPRNGPFADPAELRFVRGLDDSLISLFTTDSSKTPINDAPLVVVASLPGMTSELVAVLANRRRRDEPLRALSQLTDGLSPAARDTLLARFAELSEDASLDVEELVLQTTARVGVPAIAATITLRMRPADHRAAAVARTTW